ncbi:MAG: tetratricopeptide repeat protein [Chitinophagales bacterium]|nr:tetratricopeptide repeat protein [Chitinophagales bacterium]HAE14071.1 hypothetical protein [Bacteroidota bacterium]MCB9021075.1 tetratricopeptide repeat protein [Chitinophagales bacterium]HAE35163.1 hypothetical protein [Bacteroidota bacterium]HPE98149.1 tetratricopeptide repeat protein [Chitinophagales bacterium]
MKGNFLIILMLLSPGVFAQQENKYIQEGNKQYDRKQYDAAEQYYRQALEKQPARQEATYNLGNALYNQQKLDESIASYDAIASTTSDPSIRSKAYHNMGNAYLEKKDYEKSIEAYKQALKADPTDMDTKYNLAYARSMLKQQQDQQQQNKQDQQDKQDQQQNQDQQNQDQNKQDQQNQNQNKQDQQQQNQQQENRQPQDKKFTPEELERIMQTLNKDDKDVQNKVSKQRTEGSRTKSDKDW